MLRTAFRRRGIDSHATNRISDLMPGRIRLRAAYMAAMVVKSMCGAVPLLVFGCHLPRPLLRPVGTDLTPPLLARI